MTREEAWRRAKGYLYDALSGEEADEIIKALEEPSYNSVKSELDAISRQAMHDFIRSLTRWYVRSENGKFNNVGLLYDDVMFGIDRLQPVKPQELCHNCIFYKEEGEDDERY